MSGQACSPIPDGAVQALTDAVVAAVEMCASEAREVWAFIHANPETGFQEVRAAKALSGLLERHGFEVQRGVAGMPTAFAARFGSREPEVSVGFMAEYDALPGLGHACGHSLSGVGSALAGIALARVLPAGTSVCVFGTPAEEAVVPGAGGKLRCIEAGLFEGLDAIMMCHAAARDILETTVAARAVLNLEFFGKAAHAGADPHQGLNALTAAVQTLNGLNGLYQQLTPGHRLNAIVTDGGKVVNVIPEHAALALQLRAPTRTELDRLEAKALDCACAGALMTGCRFTSDQPSPAVSDLVPNRPLLAAYAANATRLGIQAVSEPQTCISTDAGTVSHHVPCIHPFFAVGCDPGLELHSRAFAEACGKETAFRQLCVAASILALTGHDVLTDPDLRKRIRDDFLACARTDTNSTRSF